MNQFNLNRFHQLVEKEKTFEKIGKSFSAEDEDIELFSYRNMIRDQCCFQNRWKYLNLIKDYKEKRINDSSFGQLIFYTYVDDSNNARRLEKNLEELATFLMDTKSKRFSDRIYKIDDLCHEM